MINSENGICNLALSELGSSITVENIRNPRKPVEAIFSTRYDNSRRYSLKLITPMVTTIVTDGFTYAYRIPSDSVGVLGIGTIQDRLNNYTIEGNILYTDEYSETGITLRYMKDEKDVTKYSPEFIRIFSLILAKDVCMQILQSNEKLAYLDQRLTTEMSCSASMNSQENRPIKINRSKFEKSKFTKNPTFEVKL